MLLTPEEAKTKWCPWARTLIHSSAGWGGYYVASYNRDADGHRVTTTRCLADACMAWRWDYNVCVGEEPHPTGEGYCGAGGRP